MGESGYTTVAAQNFNAINCNIVKEHHTDSYENLPWIQAVYFELSIKCETFRGYSPTISIDGGTTRDDFSRFCLACVPNIKRNVLVQRTLVHIGKGVSITKELTENDTAKVT